MIGDNKLKYIALFLIFLTLSISCGHILFAQEINVGPPGPKEVESARQGIGKKVESLFQKIKNMGKGINNFTSFFKNISQKIGSWWYLSAKPWIVSQWSSFNDYMEKEIRLE